MSEIIEVNPLRRDDNKVIEVQFPEPVSAATQNQTTTPFYESDNFDLRFLRRKNAMAVYTSLKGDEAATAENYGVFFINPFAYPLKVISVREAHTSSASEAGGVIVEKLTGTQALDGGVLITNDSFDLTGTANTIVSSALSSVVSSTILANNNRLALKDSGGLSGIRGIMVVVELQVYESF